LTNTNAIRDFQNADSANRGSFATDHPNGLCDADEDESSQVYVANAVRIVPNPPGITVDGKGVAKPVQMGSGAQISGSQPAAGQAVLARDGTATIGKLPESRCLNGVKSAKLEL
jgi:hypothetical protein